tara:strand:+ start:253 stop:633 length:381 start_codon:yes stop_codon:yes gene_type:complete
MNDYVIATNAISESRNISNRYFIEIPLRLRVKGVKKKISNQHLTDLCERSASFGSTSVLEHLIHLARETKELDGDPQDKLDLLVGEIEVALYQTYNLFKYKWDKKGSLGGKTSVAHVSKTYGVNNG